MNKYDQKYNIEVEITVEGVPVVNETLSSVTMQEASKYIEDKARKEYPEQECKVFYGTTTWGGGKILKPEKHVS